MSHSIITSTIFLCTTLLCLETSGLQAAELRSDLVIYGGTPAAVIAAQAASRMGMSVIIIEPTKHIGGMLGSGLGGTDVCEARSIGGATRKFFSRNGARYGKKIQWRLEPHVAESIFNEIVNENKVSLLTEESLQDVAIENRRIKSLRLSSGIDVNGTIFIDATYEGDLLAKAKVSYHVGRESRAHYEEPLAGVTDFTENEFPEVVSGLDLNNQLLAYITPEYPYSVGMSDSKIMAYNYRPCITKQKHNQVKFIEPPGYDAEKYRLVLQYIKAKPRTLARDLFVYLDVPNHKIDLNNRGMISLNLIGANFSYPTSDEKTRNEIRKAHKLWAQGLLYFLANDQRLPAYVRSGMSAFGLCKDEFTDNDNWPYQLYVRESRRMIGEYVLRQSDLTHKVIQPDPVALASCPIEVHFVERIKTKAGPIKHEGRVDQDITPYQIPYRSIIPQKSEIENLLVPIALSASHVAYSSLRMEPVYMMLGESAGIAAALSKKNKSTVQELDYSQLQSELTKNGQILQVAKKWIAKKLR